MSERITQELRRAMRIGYAVEDGEQVDAIRHGAFMDQCSAIDSIHANLERENDRLKCELDRVLGELDDMHKTDGISDNSGSFMQNAEHHAWAPESHYVMLPKDADGEPIHAGDVLDGYGKTVEVVELRYGRSGWVIVSRDGNAYADCAAFSHHHDPTVEDVLREMADRCYADEDEPRDRDAIVAEYAAKLRLVGDAE